MVTGDTKCQICRYTRNSHRQNDAGELVCPPGKFIPEETLISETRIREYLPDGHKDLDVAESLQILGRLFGEVGECHNLLSRSSVKFASVYDTSDTMPAGASISARVRGFVARAEHLQQMLEEHERTRNDPRRALRVLQAFIGPEPQAEPQEG